MVIKRTLPSQSVYQAYRYAFQISKYPPNPSWYDLYSRGNNLPRAKRQGPMMIILGGTLTPKQTGAQKYGPAGGIAGAIGTLLMQNITNKKAGSKREAGRCGKGRRGVTLDATSSSFPPKPVASTNLFHYMTATAAMVRNEPLRCRRFISWWLDQATPPSQITCGRELSVHVKLRMSMEFEG